MNKCTSVTGHFDDHADTLKQYGAHCQLQHVQGFTKSCWTPPSGAYLLGIVQVAARATINKMTIKQYNLSAGRFDGHPDAAVQYRAHCPMEEV